jgi:cell division septation protein DedD
METGMIYHEGRFPYSVYLGSFNTTEQVRSAIDYYQKTGIPSFWVKVNLGEKGIWYRVYSGEFADKEGAEAFINEKAIKDGEIKKTAYAVYVGSFTDRERLEKEMAILSEKGYSPYVISDENYDNLFAGAFVTKTGADELSTELNTLGIANKVVLR